MSVVHLTTTGVGTGHEVPVPAVGHPLHRLAAVRQQQGISRRTIARRLNIDLAAVRAQEDETTDISLSQLYEWQKVLEVPAKRIALRGRRFPLRPGAAASPTGAIDEIGPGNSGKCQTGNHPPHGPDADRPTPVNHAGIGRRRTMACRRATPPLG